MYILVIGAGWYGCHLALTLKREGHTVIQVDKANDFFTGSSSKNQNRLHLGFHYPRTEDTIKECQEGYPIFIDRYGQLTEEISQNIYFIATEGSLVSIDQYLSTLEHHQCDYESVDISSLPIAIQAVEYPVISVKERYINPNKAAQYFRDNLTLTELSDNCFNSIESIKTNLNQAFDLIINCTYNHLSPIDYEDYELFLTLLYYIDTSITFAYTIMDGPFFSIYPYDIERKIFTVTHVKHCVLVKSRNISTSIDICSKLILEKRHIVDEEITHFIPSWKSIASPVGYYISWKTKHNNSTCDRSVKSEIDSNIIHIYGGKITGIFQAEKNVRSVISEISNKRIE
jgi:hypothetical protein